MLVKLPAVTAVVMCISIIGGAARADLRPYLATYGYYTPIKGEIEIEQWTDIFVPQSGEASYRSKTELEYGITDRFVAALYLVNRKPTDGSFKFDSTRLEMRYRLPNNGRQFWDKAGYLEFERPNDSNKPYKTEIKGIFSHEFSKFNLTFNIIGEKELKAGEELELGYAAGIAPHSNGRIKYSLEVFGGEDQHYLMPALWIRPGRRQNFGIGVAKGLTSGSDELQVRTLYAIEF